MSDNLFDVEHVRDRTDVATFLQKLVDRLEAGEPVTLQGDDQEVTLDIPDQVEFEIQVEEETAGETSLELELEWDGTTPASSDATVDIV